MLNKVFLKRKNALIEIKNLTHKFSQNSKFHLNKLKALSGQLIGIY
jgi:hypothetical protein